MQRQKFEARYGHAAGGYYLTKSLMMDESISNRTVDHSKGPALSWAIFLEVFYMDYVKILAIICICIEIWHIIGYNFFYKVVFRVNKVMEWAKHYKSFMESFVEFADDFVESKELQEVFDVDDVMYFLQSVRFTRKSVRDDTRHKITGLCTIKELKFSLISDIIETIYWVLIIIICANVPWDAGICIIIVSIFLSKLQTYMQKHSDSIDEKTRKAVYMLDCLTFIAIFAVILFR